MKKTLTLVLCSMVGLGLLTGCPYRDSEPKDDDEYQEDSNHTNPPIIIGKGNSPPSWKRRTGNRVYPIPPYEGRKIFKKTAPERE